MYDELDRELKALAREDNQHRIGRAEHARWWAERAPPVTESGDQGVLHRDQPADALYAAPKPEDDGPTFTYPQREAISEVVKQLREEFRADIERMQQRVLQILAKLVTPGELAEREVYELKNRVIAAEERIERRIAMAMSEEDDNVVLDLPDFIRRRDAA
jgi:hypothetical protein